LIDRDLPERLAHILAHRPPTEIEAPDSEPAAVLIPLYWDRGAWHLLFTLRTETVDSHRGQVSFPGGRLEASDTGPVDAALREAEEEIGLRREDVRILGALDRRRTVTRFLVTPILGVIPWPYALTPNPVEVAQTFGVPLDWLANPAHVRLQTRMPLPPVEHLNPSSPQIVCRTGGATNGGSS
jgi:8-oxo-dGTP pyrophosphatase MutT (NUDIX family)